MISPDEFDAFYKGARSRLLLQTYALTGDLPASRSAVRDSFVGAWHHWRKVSRLPDPESWVRPHAWSQALRRHTGRPWHRDKSLDPESRATLEAMGRLPLTQRKALLLTQLTSASMGEIARELGLPLAEAERHLQTATAQFSVHRDVPSTSIRSLLDGLREQAEHSTWPRSTIIRRAGAARRRTHTLVGVGATVAAVVLSGSLVTDVGGATPSLPVDPDPTDASATDTPSDAPLEALPEDTMLDAAQVAAHAPGRRWRVTSTSDNTEGDGLVLPCQQTRFADPSGAAALVRTFDTSPRKPEPKTSAFQLSEESDSIRAARKTYATTQRWFAGCTDHRVQLMSTKRVGNVGDEASVFGLQSWAGERPKLVVGVARTGAMTTTTLVRTTAEAPTDYRSAAGLLADAVNGLCAQSSGGACATRRPQVEDMAPVPVAVAPGMLAEVDLPPVSGIVRPWVGTEPRKAMSNLAATGCDNTDFSSPPMSNNLTRSFVIPGAKLPDQFGLTQTVGTQPAAGARAFVADIRRKMAACPERDAGLGTEVTELTNEQSKRSDLSAWRLTTELSDDQSVTYLMGVVRTGTAISQVGFVPDRGATMTTDDFVDLVTRAGARLGAMPPPR